MARCYELLISVIYDHHFLYFSTALREESLVNVCSAPMWTHLLIKKAPKPLFHLNNKTLMAAQRECDTLWPPSLSCESQNRNLKGLRLSYGI